MAVVKVGIDTGGTFTDGVRVVGGRVRSVKVPSTPQDPGRAVRQALEALGGLKAGGRLHHGSTVGTNAVLTREGARVAFVTTAGFADVLRLGRGDRDDLHALAPGRTEPLVPRDRCFGVQERMGADGRVVTPLEAASLEDLARALTGLEVEAVAVSLVHAARAPRHERAVVARLRKAMAGAGVSFHLASELSADPREVERARTVVLDAFVGPKVVAYVTKLARGLPRGALTIQRSDGGRMTVGEVKRAPLRTLLSGPAAGVAAAHDITRRLRLGRALSFDVGGTSTDVAWIEEGELPVREVLTVGEHRASVPSLALETVGAGGGSVVRIDEGGALCVGPASAGAVPGPACYGQGGPFTLTDAWRVLGRLPDALLGGAFPLDPAASEAAGRPLAKQAGVSLVRLAAGAVAVAGATTARALRRASVAEGHDPRGAHLIAFGGAGPQLAAETADLLELASVVVPKAPGALAAWGTLLAPLRADLSRVIAGRKESAWARVRKALEDDVRTRLVRQGATAPRLSAEIDVRYVGQAFTVTVPLSRAWRRAFDGRHAARFGFSDPARDVEVVRLRVRGVGSESDRGPRRRLRTRSPRRHAAKPHAQPGGITHYRRLDLKAGATFDGPALVEEDTATTWIPGGVRASLNSDGDLVMEREA